MEETKETAKVVVEKAQKTKKDKSRTWVAKKSPKTERYKCADVHSKEARMARAQQIKEEKQEANYYLAMRIAKDVEDSADDFSYTTASVNKAIALARAILKAHLAIKSRA